MISIRRLLVASLCLACAPGFAPHIALVKLDAGDAAQAADSDGSVDGGADAGDDAGQLDGAMMDAGSDGGSDAGVDGGVDAGASNDGGSDAGASNDGGSDAGDGSVIETSDGSVDGGADAGGDAGADAGLDAGWRSCSGPDFNGHTVSCQFGELCVGVLVQGTIYYECSPRCGLDGGCPTGAGCCDLGFAGLPPFCDSLSSGPGGFCSRCGSEGVGYCSGN